ncbi:universal stress protein [Williamsia sp. 1138]|uniref:universal stress protein n=1 Tax=Williamsia sp. 1138 TaxID=1903117 RepID=UPI00143DCFF8|nr:universal stress protein [Williamsia sp. 1138]
MENKPVVVGIDGSAAALDAVRWAAHEAILHATRLTIVCCVDDDILALSDYPWPDRYYEQLKEHAQKDLAEASSVAVSEILAAGSDIAVDTRMLLCDARIGLQRFAATAQVLVVGAYGETRRASGLLGSVAEAVSTHAGCRVVVVREQLDSVRESMPNTVVVGVDGSRCSELAVESAFEEASLRNASLLAIHAWNFKKIQSVFSTDHRALSWKETRTAEEAVLSESLAGQSDRYPDVEVTQQVHNSDPVGALRDAGDNACLLVVGSHGRGGFTGRLLGSTSRALLHTVTCPILVVRA